jgi:hypothetical protein
MSDPVFPASLPLLLTQQAERVAALSRQWPDFVVNGEMAPFLRFDGPVPRLAIAADNPGAEERARGQFLCGPAGRQMRRFLDAALGPAPSFGRLVYVFNKSNYFTPKTAQFEQLVRGRAAADALRRAILADMEENGRFAARLAALGGIAVVTLGLETGTVFRPFRHALEEEARRLAPLAPRFLGEDLPAAFRKAPHPSYSQLFRKNGDAVWNAALDAFAERWRGRYPDLVTANGNVSLTALLATGERAMALDYLFALVLGHPLPPEALQAARDGLERS